MIEPTLNPANVSAGRTIGPVLDCMETCGGLSLTECDRIRHELTFFSRFKEFVATVNSAGDMCRRLLGASVEVCLPERAPMFLREERGNEIVFLHVGDYNGKLVQPLLKQAVQSSSRYGVTVSEDAIQPGDAMTDRLLDHLLKRNVRMVVPIITPQALHSSHWSALGYEFSVQNKDLVFPVFAYPEGTRNRLVEVLSRRCAGMLDMPSTEVPMTEVPLSSTKISLLLTEVLRKVR
ncbi:Hypp3605 [Branchiostoma lanceolatum]|uniref:Hypp3605 protein n=1 Tax=Branchiostoma lanceolatum TaxID=7740 RepID=A0A8K0EUT9_BRALA|nr:Hypp3605 [Branchiostoma lanceolatum]